MTKGSSPYGDREIPAHVASGSGIEYFIFPLSRLSLTSEVQLYVIKLANKIQYATYVPQFAANLYRQRDRKRERKKKWTSASTPTETRVRFSHECRDKNANMQLRFVFSPSLLSSLESCCAASLTKASFSRFRNVSRTLLVRIEAKTREPHRRLVMKNNWQTLVIPTDHARQANFTTKGTTFSSIFRMPSWVYQKFFLSDSASFFGTDPFYDPQEYLSVIFHSVYFLFFAFLSFPVYREKNESLWNISFVAVSAGKRFQNP